MSKKENKFRSRSISFLLYPDDFSHVYAMEQIKSNYDYVAILHDKDFYAEDVLAEDGTLKYAKGEIKKAHWHVILRFKNATWNSAICKELGIEINYSEQIRNFDNAMMYLIHYNDSDKYQYDVKEVFGTFKNRLTDILNNQNKSEGEKIVELIDFIENKKGYLSVTEFARYCANNGYWAEFRRSGSIFCKMIDEKNEKYKKKD